ncbi:hypothetical protein IFM89_030010 [Coptis chinensis]|uniref:Glycerol-3-phosphate acyltransferase RAM2/GPAT1-8 HAD-like domain-containing protein n=1 Tax=Coptis chinensis TaxID=261450 RepID=A0A835IGG3_9MAGN|nr:hypothetical protein IFM89_030010 [Coptis chinensis]
MNHEIRLRVMVFITFCGLKLKYMDSVGRAVLPKFYLENLNLQAYEVLASTGRKVLNYRIMEGMYFISFVDGPGLLVKHKALKEFFGDDKPDIGLGSSNSVHDHLFISLCKDSIGRYYYQSLKRANEIIGAEGSTGYYEYLMPS